MTYVERAADGSWVREHVITDPVSGRIAGRIAFDAAGEPHVAASIGGLDDRVMYAHRSAGQWTVESIPEAGSVTHVGLMLDDGIPHLVSCKWTNASAVTHHWRAANGWQNEVVDSRAYSPYQCGAVDDDATGRIHTLYGEDVDDGLLDLRHAVLKSNRTSVRSLGTYVRGDIELIIDQKTNVAHVLAMSAVPGEAASLSRRVAQYFTMSLGGAD